MANFFNTPLFGLTLSVLAYTLGLSLYRRFPNPLTTPLLVSTALIIVILHYTGISYRDYYVGGSYLNSLIIPSTVALAVPFYKNLHLMRHHCKSILIGSTVACILNTTYTALIAKLFGMDYFLSLIHIYNHSQDHKLHDRSCMSIPTRNQDHLLVACRQE